VVHDVEVHDVEVHEVEVLEVEVHRIEVIEVEAEAAEEVVEIRSYLWVGCQKVQIRSVLPHLLPFPVLCSSYKGARASK
jgi:hypothetical protein